MNFKTTFRSGVAILIKVLAPKIKTILSSLISNIGKSLYEKLFEKLKDAVESFEAALEKLTETKDEKKLKKRLICCKIGFGFFEKINEVLTEMLPDYAAIIEEKENEYEDLTGKKLEIIEAE